MQPLNYLRRAIPGCEQSLRGLGCYTPEYGDKAREVLAECRGAMKFVLPDNGKIFNDDLRGLPDDVRLPFDQIVIEYQCNNEDGVASRALGADATHEARERIILAQQDGSSIWVFSVIQMHMADGAATWYVQPFCAAVSMAKDLDPDEMAKATADAKKMAIAGAKTVESIGVHYYDLGGGARRAFGPGWEDHAHLNLMDELGSVLELIEALSCSNVQHEALPVRKPNKAAEKRGALPFDEYRILTVRSTVAAPGGIPTVLPFGHRSPREHLRRGHIRRLQDGRRIWINSTVVNAGTHGVITKSYRMAA